MKFLMWLVLAVLVVLALRKKSSTISSAQQQAPLDGGPTGSSPNPHQANQHAETMVCCEHCQVYVPASEAVYRQQQVFCSVVHADLH
ncbi:uncharacterized protein AAKU61_003342 [Undibacterium sp. GrIS 1.2]|uniref:PP0621 family protein n=1 Tax=Undibacterium sp. GrIS 1.2 TaxID=3143933 RepID=UPI003396CDC3